ncbi:TnsA-like heteromeric transposase endonuclease subunit [Yimella lutea]|uniref:TnsA-like heteromeric transposase endonuclease subunit n=1 Tax=Yimella lutea TaxID=587872 RepID=UPI0014775578|nr:TnsA-like heteromeric transposase endonuclease subunit [Yimella lutea]
MTTNTLLDTELRYVADDGTEVTTSVRHVDQARVARGLPVRKIRSRAGQRHYSGLFWSATTQGHVPYESRLELDRLWLADFDSSVTWIAAQPFWMSGRDGDALRRHAPDFMLSRVGAPPLVVDVKPAQFATKAEVEVVFRWTREVCASRGWAYEVWTGGDPVILANIRALAVGRRRSLFAHDPAALSMSTGLARLGDGWEGLTVTNLKTPLSVSDVWGSP